MLQSGPDLNKPNCNIDGRKISAVPLLSLKVAISLRQNCFDAVGQHVGSVLGYDCSRKIGQSAKERKKKTDLDILIKFKAACLHADRRLSLISSHPVLDP
jgi:hypothetical protein